MKRFKQIDICISTGLIVGFSITYVFQGFEILMQAYFITGGWQVISMLVHAFNKWFTSKGSIRLTYHWIVLVIIGMGTVGVPIFFIIYYIMLFAAPFMAIFYTLLCYLELRVMNKRPLADLQ